VLAGVSVFVPPEFAAFVDAASPGDGPGAATAPRCDENIASFIGARIALKSSHPGADGDGEPLPLAVISLFAFFKVSAGSLAGLISAALASRCGEDAASFVGVGISLMSGAGSGSGAT
jgi:hypothetical protein